MAKDCTFSVNSKNVKVKWTAFKTLKKVGVSGGFDKLGIEKAKTGKNLSELVTGTKFNIDVKSVNSGDKGRDEKLVKFFFNNMKSKSMFGKISKMSKGIVKLDLTMNGTKKTIPMIYKVKGNRFTATGHLDVLDFYMSKSLKGINEACSELHEGKTWNDVDIALEFNFNKKCK